jgi:hypothetical protein
MADEHERYPSLRRWLKRPDRPLGLPDPDRRTLRGYEYVDPQFLRDIEEVERRIDRRAQIKMRERAVERGGYD